MGEKADSVVLVPDAQGKDDRSAVVAGIGPCQGIFHRTVLECILGAGTVQVDCGVKKRIYFIIRIGKGCFREGEDVREASRLENFCGFPVF